MISYTVAKKNVSQQLPIQGVSGLFLTDQIPTVASTQPSNAFHNLDVMEDLVKRIDDEFSNKGRSMPVEEFEEAILEPISIKKKSTTREKPMKIRLEPKKPPPVPKPRKNKSKPLIEGEERTLLEQSLPLYLKLDPVSEDQNSALRCFSKHLFNDQNGHHSIRQKGIAYIKKHKVLFEDFVDNFEEYINKSSSDTKVDDILLIAAAISHKTNLFVKYQNDSEFHTLFKHEKFTNDIFLLLTTTGFYHLLKNEKNIQDIVIFPMSDKHDSLLKKFQKKLEKPAPTSKPPTIKVIEVKPNSEKPNLPYKEVTSIRIEDTPEPIPAEWRDPQSTRRDRAPRRKRDKRGSKSRHQQQRPQQEPIQQSFQETKDNKNSTTISSSSNKLNIEYQKNTQTVTRVPTHQLPNMWNLQAQKLEHEKKIRELALPKAPTVTVRTISLTSNTKQNSQSVSSTVTTVSGENTRQTTPRPPALAEWNIVQNPVDQAPDQTADSSYDNYYPTYTGQRYNDYNYNRGSHYQGGGRGKRGDRRYNRYESYCPRVPYTPIYGLHDISQIKDEDISKYQYFGPLHGYLPNEYWPLVYYGITDLNMYYANPNSFTTYNYVNCIANMQNSGLVNHQVANNQNTTESEPVSNCDQNNNSNDQAVYKATLPNIDVHEEDVLDPIPQPSEVAYPRRYRTSESMNERMVLYKPPGATTEPPLPRENGISTGQCRYYDPDDTVHPDVPIEEHLKRIDFK